MVCAYFFKFDNELSKNRKLQKYRIILSQNANNLPTQTIPTYSVRMREKIDQNNSEYGHFRRSVAGFNFFIEEWINQTYTMTLAFLVSEMGLTTLLAQQVSILRAKL